MAPDIGPEPKMQSLPRTVQSNTFIDWRGVNVPAKPHASFWPVKVPSGRNVKAAMRLPPAWPVTPAYWPAAAFGLGEWSSTQAGLAATVGGRALMVMMRRKPLCATLLQFKDLSN